MLAIVIYRVTTQAALQMSTVSTARSNVRLTVVSTAVIINLVVILILDEVYAKVAVWLTQLGQHGCWRHPRHRNAAAFVRQGQSTNGQLNSNWWGPCVAHWVTGTVPVIGRSPIQILGSASDFTIGALGNTFNHLLPQRLSDSASSI